MSKRRRVLSSVAVVGIPVLVSAFVVFAQVQSSGQQKCLNGINKDGANVAKTQGKENTKCLKGAGTGSVPAGMAQACLTADADGKVQKADGKTTALDAASCSPPPSFGYTGASNTNTAGSQREVALVGDVFGGNLDSAVISCSSNKPGCQCQQKVLGAVEKLADTKLGIFVKCKKAALTAGANSSAALEKCVSDGGTPGSISADTGGKIAKSRGKLSDAITKKCDTPGVTTGAFPGNCTGLNGTSNPTLGTCLDQQVECRVCQLLNQADGLQVDCDMFDDGLANASCTSFTGPTPTPTATPSPPTPTATQTCAPGPAFQGALPPTVGRFNYNLTLGLPGANSACNTHYAGSHVCTVFELQCAQAAGSLVGAMDTPHCQAGANANAFCTDNSECPSSTCGSNAITSFWAVDSAAPPLAQCQDDVSSFQRWEYATAHTMSRGQKLPLNNGTGMLGALQTGLQCNFSGNSNVGCCQ